MGSLWALVEQCANCQAPSVQYVCNCIQAQKSITLLSPCSGSLLAIVKYMYCLRLMNSLLPSPPFLSVAVLSADNRHTLLQLNVVSTSQA